MVYLGVHTVRVCVRVKYVCVRACVSVRYVRELPRSLDNDVSPAWPLDSTVSQNPPCEKRCSPAWKFHKGLVTATGSIGYKPQGERPLSFVRWLQKQFRRKFHNFVDSKDKTYGDSFKGKDEASSSLAFESLLIYPLCSWREPPCCLYVPDEIARETRPFSYCPEASVLGRICSFSGAIGRPMQLSWVHRVPVVLAAGILHF